MKCVYCGKENPEQIKTKKSLINPVSVTITITILILIITYLRDNGIIN